MKNGTVFEVTILTITQCKKTCLPTLYASIEVYTYFMILTRKLTSKLLNISWRLGSDAARFMGLQLQEPASV